MTNYFHVVVTLKSNLSSPYLFRDFSEAELKKRFVGPYQMGKSVMNGNDCIALMDISSVQISRTSEIADTVLRKMRDDSKKTTDRLNADSHRTGVFFGTMGFGWRDSDIVHAGEDVTASYIKEGPGSGTMLTKLGGLTQNQLVAGLGVGILVMLLGLLFAA